MWRAVAKMSGARYRACGASRHASRRPVLHQRWLAVLTSILLVSFTSGCRVVPPVVKIGLVAPFEGRNRAVGYDVIYAARLAVHEINNAGGVDGAKVALVAHDDFGDPETAAAVAASLALDPSVVAVLGHWQSDTTQAAAPIYAAAELAFVPMGSPPFGAVSADALPASFLEAYATVTPFDETAGPYAATAYDAVYLVAAAIEHALKDRADGVVARVKGVYDGDTITRSAVAASLTDAIVEGVTGDIAMPQP